MEATIFDPERQCLLPKRAPGSTSRSALGSQAACQYRPVRSKGRRFPPVMADYTALEARVADLDQRMRHMLPAESLP
jgi:hypothetical protein